MHSKPPSTKKYSSLIVLVLLLVLSACSLPSAGETPSVEPGSSGPTLTPFIPETLTPTATPEPAAIRVNGEAILLEDFNAEIARLVSAQAELGITASDAERQQMVLDEMIGETLLAQAAYKDGFSLEDATLEAHIQELTAASGGEEAFNTWKTANNYTDDGLRRALRRSMAAAWQRDQIAAQIPTSMEQVHAAQILVLDSSLADLALSQLENGVDFATVVDQYDPTTHGDLGWFPRGYLTQPAIEEFAFSAAVGEYSPVIETEFGYHIVYVMDKGDHPLSPAALQLKQREAVNAWIADALANSQIEKFIGQ